MKILKTIATLAVIAATAATTIAVNRGPAEPTNPLNQETGSFGLTTDLLFGQDTAPAVTTGDTELDTVLAAHAEATPVTIDTVHAGMTCEEITATIPVPPGVTVECAADAHAQWEAMVGPTAGSTTIKGFWDGESRIVVGATFDHYVTLLVASHEAGHAWDVYLLDSETRAEIVWETGGSRWWAPVRDLDAHRRSGHETWAHTWAYCQVGIAPLAGWFVDAPSCSDLVRWTERAAANRAVR